MDEHIEKAKARELIAKCEADLRRKLTDGQKRDLLADNTQWTSEFIRRMVAELSKPAIADASPADRANDVIIAYRNWEFPVEELYDRLQAAGLSPEEADEMCNLELEF